MKNFFILVFSIGVFSGCSSTYQIRSSVDAQTNLEEKNGDVFAAGDAKYEGRCFHVLGDSLTFIDQHSDRPITLALSDITSVKRWNHDKGAVQGALISMGAPLVMIATSSVFISDKNNGKSLGPNTIYFLIGGVAAWGGVGALVGGIAGNQETYNFDRDLLNANTKTNEHQTK